MAAAGAAAAVVLLALVAAAEVSVDSHRRSVEREISSHRVQ